MNKPEKLDIKGNRRVVGIMGSKGGVGKTTVAASLADFYRSTGVKYLAIDADTGNTRHGSLAHLIGCEKLDIRGRVGLDALIDKALGGWDLVLVDFGAGSADELARWVGDIGEALAAEGVALTLVALISEELATADTLLKCAEKVQDRAAYVLAENHGKGDVAATLAMVGIQEFEKVAQPAHVVIDPLRVDLAQELDRVGQTPQAAIEAPKSEKLKTASARIRLTAWVKKLHQQFENTEALLPR